MLRYVRAEKQDLKKEIADKKELDDALRTKISDAISAFKKTFQA